MILYHATHKSNLESIREHGINPDFSQCKEKVIYLHTKSRREWAILHIFRRHKISRVNLCDVVVLTVDIPRRRLKRRRRGLWTTDQPITNIIEITNATEFSK